jgi:hypothetical protein
MVRVIKDRTALETTNLTGPLSPFRQDLIDEPPVRAGRHRCEVAGGLRCLGFYVVLPWKKMKCDDEGFAGGNSSLTLKNILSCAPLRVDRLHFCSASRHNATIDRADASYPSPQSRPVHAFPLHSRDAYDQAPRDRSPSCQALPST